MGDNNTLYVKDKEDINIEMINSDKIYICHIIGGQLFMYHIMYRIILQLKKNLLSIGRVSKKKIIIFEENGQSIFLQTIN